MTEQRFSVGDRVQMPDVPFVVVVTGVGTCEDGPECRLGPDIFSFEDPGGLGTDWMHMSDFVRVP